MQMVQTHMDEIDAAQAGELWLTELGVRRGADMGDMHSCERNGGIRSVWKGRRLLAYYICLRDQLNWTVLACHDLSEDLEPGWRADEEVSSEDRREKVRKAAKVAINRLRNMPYEELLKITEKESGTKFPGA